VSLFRSLFETRATKEGPWTVSDGGALSFLGFSDSNTTSGMYVDEISAMNCTSVFACVRVISESIGSMPLVLYRREGDARRRADDTTLYDLLYYQPNPNMTSMVWRETLTGHVLLWGNHYSRIIRDRSANVTQLVPLNPSRMKVELSSSNEVVYRYERSESEPEVPKILRSEEVFHVPGLGFNGLVGMSVIRANAETIGLSLAATKYGGAFFGNGSRPGGVIKSEKMLSPEAKKALRESWEAAHQGVQRGSRVGVLDGNLQWQDVGINPEDAQFLEQRQFQTEEIARMFRVPLVLLQSPVQGAVYGAGVEALMQAFVTYTLRPYMARVEQEIHRKLLRDSEKKVLFAEHLTAALLSADLQSRYAAHVQGRSWGFLSINDVRRMENMDPLPGPEGDEYIVPANYVPADKVGALAVTATQVPTDDAEPEDEPAEEPTDEPAEDDSRDLLEPLLLRELTKMVSRQATDIRKALDSKDAAAFSTWLETRYKSVPEWLADICGAALNAVYRARGEQHPAEREVEWCWTYAELSKREIEEAMRLSVDRDMDSRTAVLMLMDEWNKHRARTLAASVFEEVRHAA